MQYRVDCRNKERELSVSMRTGPGRKDGKAPGITRVRNSRCLADGVTSAELVQVASD